MIFIIIGIILIAGNEEVIIEALGCVAIMIGTTVLYHKQLNKEVEEKEPIE